MNSAWRRLQVLMEVGRRLRGGGGGLGLCLSTLPVVHALDLSDRKIQLPRDTDLSHEKLLQQAASVSVNSASQLLTQTAVAIIDTASLYKQALLKLISLLEEGRGGIIQQSPRDSDAVIELRAEVDRLKNQLQELDSLLEFVERVVVSTAETCYIMGAEFVSISLTDRLHSIKQQLDEKRRDVSSVERDCLLLQQQVINNTK